MRVLALDSALGAASVAILERDDATGAERVLAHRADATRAGAAETMVPLIAEALAEAALDLGRIDRLAVTVGPGRFTSLRIALAAARGLALARGLPLVGITTFEALAAMAPPGPGLVVAAIPAGRGQIAAQAFGAAGPLGAFEVGAPDAVGARLPPGPWRLIGPAAQDLSIPDLERPDGPSGDPVAAPDARVIARLALDRAPGAPVMPVYARPPDVRGPADAPS